MDDRIKVLFLIFSFDIEAIGGGISRFVVNLSQELDPRIFQVSICGLWNRGTEFETQRMNELNEVGIKAFTCSPWDELHPYRAFFNSYRVLSRYIREFPVDIVHSHSLFGDIAALWLNFEGKTPVILRTLHNELRTEWNRRPVRRLLLTNLLYALVFTAEIGVSQYIVDGLDKRWLARQLGRQALMIHNAVDLERFSIQQAVPSMVRQELSIPETAFLVGSVGRLTRQKGYDLLLEAFAAVSAQISELYLLLIGDGEDAASLNQKARDLNIEKKVIFTGPRTDVDRLLASTDLFVCSSRWEGFSTVLMEAMAEGIPILATDIPGNRELVQPEISAWMVPPEDPHALAEGLLKAYHNRGISSTYAKNARITVQSFGIKKIALVHQALYRFIKQNQTKRGWFTHRESDSRFKTAINKP